MATDRDLLKKQQSGALGTSGASDARTAVRDAHSRARDFLKVGAENAATNVAETPCFTVPRASALRSISILTSANVANDTSDYVLVTFYKRTAAGASQTLIGSYNTHTSAQGAITLNVPAAASLVSNSDAQIAAGSVITYAIGKLGSGKALAQYSTFTFDFEEV